MEAQCAEVRQLLAGLLEQRKQGASPEALAAASSAGLLRLLKLKDAHRTLCQSSEAARQVGRSLHRTAKMPCQRRA